MADESATSGTMSTALNDSRRIAPAVARHRIATGFAWQPRPVATRAKVREAGEISKRLRTLEATLQQLPPLAARGMPTADGSQAVHYAPSAHRAQHMPSKAPLGRGRRSHAALPVHTGRPRAAAAEMSRYIDTRAASKHGVTIKQIEELTDVLRRFRFTRDQARRRVHSAVAALIERRQVEGELRDSAEPLDDEELLNLAFQGASVAA